MGAQELTLGVDGNWGFGQNREERKWAFELNIVVDVIGQYILNANGGRQNEKELGRGEAADWGVKGWGVTRNSV